MTPPSLPRRLAIVPAVVGCMLSLTQPATAADDERASIQPAKAGGQTRLHFILDLRPSTTTRDSLTLANRSTEPVTFDLYAADAFNDAQGAFVLRRADDAKVGLGAWVVLPTDHVTVPAQSTSQVDFDVVVPASATPGDHAGGIVALARGGDGFPGSGNVALRIRNGVGVRIYGRVHGPATPALAITRLDVNPKRPLSSQFGLSTSAEVVYEVKNTGNVRLIPTIEVEVGNAVTGRMPQEKQQLPELLPGQSTTARQTVDDLASTGRAKVKVVATAQTARAVRTTTVWVVPWLLLGLVALVVVTVVALLRRRRRPRAAAPSGPEAQREPVGAAAG